MSKRAEGHPDNSPSNRGLDDGVALTSAAHPLGRQVKGRGIRKFSIETVDIEIPIPEMVLRIAMALAVCDQRDAFPDAVPLEWMRIGRRARKVFIAYAYAALEAIRESTEAMRNAGVRSLNDSVKNVGDFLTYHPGITWTAMVDAAKAPPIKWGSKLGDQRK